ncbi:MAG: type II toxin-antitoxin system VapC family toxin [Actinomycetia bacterium]|nr:type II toxin-antitoxin system VapC family toxin [Actinomycetes bacterium]
MKLPDANLLLYAYNPDSPHHLMARNWLEETLSGTETVAMGWQVLMAFLRVSTAQRLFEDPLGIEEALDVVESWLDQPCTTIVHPTRRHSAVLRELLGPLGIGGSLTSDAHLAALAIEHGAELYSCDWDFARFPTLRWVNPLA